MHRGTKVLAALCVVATASAGVVADDSPVPRQAEMPGQGIVFATALLSEAEQADYRARIRAATNEAEREDIRSAHYELMRARARERGQTLPERRPTTVGEGESPFGPQLITEEERAAQRARLRSGGGNPPVVQTNRSRRSEQAVEVSAPEPERRTVVSGRQSNPARLDDAAPKSSSPSTRPGESAVDEGIRPGTQAGATSVGPAEHTATSAEGPGPVKPVDRVQAMAPSSPSGRSVEPAMGGIVLPGLEAIFGPQLMSEDERAAFRSRLRNAKSDGERQAIRAERDAQLRSRAQEKGVTLPQ